MARVPMRATFITLVATMAYGTSDATKPEPDDVRRELRDSEEFIWKHGRRVIGRLRVPTGFKVDVYDYREGSVTTLHFPDGAAIILQVGGMYNLPMFQAPVHELNSTRARPEKRIRFGTLHDSPLLWREDNYHRGKLAGRHVSLLQLFPPNIGYRGVSSCRRAEFDAAMDSFIRDAGRGGRSASPR